jgi:hypothetical protein
LLNILSIGRPGYLYGDIDAPLFNDDVEELTLRECGTEAMHFSPRHFPADCLAWHR